MAHMRISPHQALKMIADFDAGMLDEDISLRYGLSLASTKRWKTVLMEKTIDYRNEILALRKEVFDIKELLARSFLEKMLLTT